MTAASPQEFLGVIVLPIALVAIPHLHPTGATNLAAIEQDESIRSAALRDCTPRPPLENRPAEFRSRVPTEFGSW